MNATTNALKALFPELEIDLQTELSKAVQTAMVTADIITNAEIVARTDSAQYYLDNMSHCPAFQIDLELLQAGLSWRKFKGLILEFGVAWGRTINHIANTVSNEPVYGFDWFKGLPENWRTGFPAGSFAQEKVPAVPANVSLVHGLFENTIEPFLKEHEEPVSFIHVDCDIYSSTVTIFEKLQARIVPGTVIVFDEYFNYRGWRLHEYKAFQEFVSKYNRRYEYLGFVPQREQVCVRIVS